MYLNIINNIKHESKRKRKKIDYNLENEKNEKENEINNITYNNFSYYSVFYGNLTKNWIQLTN